MNDQVRPAGTRVLASPRRRILGSLVAPLIAFATVNGHFFINDFLAEDSSGRWVFPALIAPFATSLIFGTWLLVVLPLVLFVRPRSVFWSWLPCALCGALACAAIVTPWVATDPNRSFFWVLAAVSGGQTCLIASLTRHRFMYDRNALQAGSSNGG